MATRDTKSYWQRYRSIPIVYRIGAAFVLGSVVGLIVGEPVTVLEPLGDIFVRLLSMIVVPIVIFTLLMGIRRISPSTLGRVGGQVIGLYAVMSAIAVVIGLAAANLVNPGTGLTLTEDVEFEPADTPDFLEVIVGIVPENPIGAMAEGDVLATIFFVIVFGLALLLLEEETEDETIRSGVESIFDIVEAGTEALFKIVWGIMEYGVIGVFALMAAVFGQAGIDALVPFALLIGTLLGAILVHIGVVYLGGLIIGLTRQSPVAFLVGSKDAIVTALSIRSSSGTLPVTMANADDNLRINEGVYGFSLPLGATINMDGTAMYQGVVAVFAANLVGVQLTLVEQVTVVLIAVLASIGAGGVPGTGLIMLTLVLTQLGLPLEVVGFVAGVDPILDRLRTMTNVTGDLAVTTVVAHWNDAIDFDSGSWVDPTRGLEIGESVPGGD
ncbi:dicarboxylate/amino acid:cation symporter [Halobiforma lacisalsi AJ5]|uniref:Dicarboxylate/amino acid:cation symporter n=1 Tax=Natronobacterium lacisalsi AJ5 TaxID=358396 RepID=M0LIM2_NATLA|nr:dicarboxylate/amino acid:cation symporter [Halobiforma lacisalsi]APW96382.1 dicarboxylate/amino acid:cation symporter [Halobiforma lacisalsi AJ5]EMA31850.1 sodium:dicarboxylate symporter [Halobiforma lacisalsi AJ5]